MLRIIVIKKQNADFFITTLSHARMKVQLQSQGVLS